MTPCKYTLRFKSGNRGQLDEVITIKANNIIAAGRKWSQLVGKQGLHGLYIPQHAQYGWGQWFVVSNGPVNATYEVQS